MTRIARSPRPVSSCSRASAERGRQQAAVARGQLGAKVDRRHPGLRPGRAGGKPDAAVPAGARVAHALDGWRCAAEDHGGTRPRREQHRGVTRLEPRSPVALVGGLVLLVDDHEPEVGERCQERRPRAHDHVDRARPDPPPFVRPLTLAETRMQDGDGDPQLHPQPVHDRRGERDLRNEEEGRTPGRERRRDGLDVDRGLAPAGDAVEQQGRGVATLDRLEHERHGARLGPREDRTGGSCAALERTPAGAGPARALAYLRANEPTTHQPGDRRCPVDVRESRCRRPVRRAPGVARAPSRRLREDRPVGLVGLVREVREVREIREVRENGSLADPQDPPGRAFARGQRLGRAPPVIGQPQPALVARAGRRREQRPRQVEQARVGQRPEPAEQAGAPFGRRQVTHGPRPSGDLVEQVDLHRGQAVAVRLVDGRRVAVGRVARGRSLAERRLARGRDLGHQLQPLQHPGRQHRPDHDRQRGQVPPGDDAREGQRERRQQRPVAPHPGHDPAHLAGRRRGHVRTRPDDDPDSLAAATAERHEDRLAGFDVGQVGGQAVRPGSRPGPRGRVDGNLDQGVGGNLRGDGPRPCRSAGGGRRRNGSQGRSGRAGRIPGRAVRTGERQVRRRAAHDRVRARRSGCAGRCCAASPGR